MKPATVEVRPRLTLPEARVLAPDLNMGPNPVLSMSVAERLLRDAEERAFRSPSGIIDNGGTALIGAILALREAIARAVTDARLGPDPSKRGNA